MPDPLYLDTARLGQMSPRACRASVDFARFASEQGCSLYLSRFLAEGAAAWPDGLSRRYPGLADWQGVAQLKRRLKAIAGADDASEVLLAARSAELMRFAAKLIIGPCRNVLLTDLSWPAYESVFERERRSSTCRRTRLLLRRHVLYDGISPDDFIELTVRHYIEQCCDGLFIPLVDNLGVRLPVERLVERLRQEAELRFVVVDGAQAIGHVPLDLCKHYCDLLLAGCHKWLRAFLPLGLTFYGAPGSRSYIEDSALRWQQDASFDDPLLRFCCELQGHTTTPYGETVQVQPLLSANGAAIDASLGVMSHADSTNRTNITAIAETSGWKSLSTHSAFASRILLFEHERPDSRMRPPDDVRALFLAQGVSLSCYETGLIRLSLPDHRLGVEELRCLETAFASVRQ